MLEARFGCKEGKMTVRGLLKLFESLAMQHQTHTCWRALYALGYDTQLHLRKFTKAVPQGKAMQY